VSTVWGEKIRWVSKGRTKCGAIIKPAGVDGRWEGGGVESTRARQIRVDMKEERKSTGEKY